MGRYDKIKVWDGSAWVKPKQMRIRALMKSIRYIYVFQDGSDKNDGNHLCQVEAYTKDGTNVAVGKTITCGPEDHTVENGANALKSSLDETYARIIPEDGARTWFIIDLGKGYDLDYIKVWRYYSDGRTYRKTAITVVGTDGHETRLHEYTQEPLYAESSSGYTGKWINLGTDDSSNTRPFHVWDGTNWIRKSLNREVSYGDKEWNVSSEGTGGWLDIDSGANINQNKFNFYFYCMKDYDNDKLVASFGSTSQGWRLMWLADGRIQWNTYYGNATTASYSSNYRKAFSWSVVNAYSDSTGTGDGTLNFGGTKTSINRTRRHQYNNQSFNIGGWGMFYRDKIRSYGINGSGDYVDRYGYIDDLSVKSGSQSAGYLHLNSNNTVTQDTTVSWV